MPTDFARAAIAVLAIAATGGCASSGKTSLYMQDDNWGEANRQTMAAQIVDPLPQYDSAAIEANGEHTAQAIERYRTDRVKKPERVKTSNGGANGGGGS